MKKQLTPAERGRRGGLIGGRARSEAKTAACRANAKKPRKKRTLT